MNIDIQATKRLADILIEAGMLKEEDLQVCLQIQKKTGERLGKILIEQHFTTEEAVAKALEHQLAIPYLALSSIQVLPEVLSLIPREIMERELALPILRNGDRLSVAVADPLNQSVVDTIHRLTGCHIELYISTPSAMREFLGKTFGMRSKAEHAVAALKEDIEQRKVDEETKEKRNQVSKAKEEVAAIVRLVDSLITQAVYDRASDIHIEPGEEEVRVRYRRDGILQNVMTFPKAVQEEVIVRIKILSGMDISERRHPQDGHHQIVVDNRDIDLRISSFPGVLGEKIVIRLLDQRMTVVQLEELGFSDEHLKKLEKIIRTPYGLFLITGPTGSGKTTTLYAILQRLNKESVNIITIEDPVEYRFPTITQLQVNSAIQLDFVDGLRSSLRQDPDVILVGEIRDKETLETAIQASMTGHMVLSTLHTNNAILAFPRMVQLGVPPDLIFSGLLGMMAQRLVRKLCPHCRKKQTVSGDALRSLGFKIHESNLEAYAPVGCDKCGKRGYSGRVAIAEVFLLSNELKSLFLKGTPINEIRAHLASMNETFLEDDALAKIKAGVTSIEEVMRVVNVGEQ